MASKLHSLWEVARQDPGEVAGSWVSFTVVTLGYECLTELPIVQYSSTNRLLPRWREIDCDPAFI